MSCIPFCTVCDFCGRKSEEYGGWPVCRECLQDTCDTCAAEGTIRDEEGDCLCIGCHEQERQEALADDALELLKERIRTPSTPEEWREFGESVADSLPAGEYGSDD